MSLGIKERSVPVYMNIQLQSNITSPWNKVQMAVQSVERSTARQSGRARERRAEEERRQDRVSLNPMNQLQSRLENLMSQKQSIIEQKNQLIADTLDAGGDIKSIQSMVSLYEEQIANIETQISQTMKEMMEGSLDEKEEEEEKEEEPLTKEEQQRRQMAEISNASMEHERTGQIYSAYVHKRGEANVMAQEIETDGSRGGATEGKQRRLNGLKQEMDALYTETMEGYADLSVSLQESAEEASHRHELEGEEETKEKEDKEIGVQGEE